MSDTIDVIRAAIEAELLEIQIKHVLTLMARGYSQDDAVQFVKQHSPPIDDMAQNVRDLASAIDCERQTIN